MNSRKRGRGGEESRQKPADAQASQGASKAVVAKAEQAAEVLVATIKQNPQILEQPRVQQVVRTISKYHSGPLPCPEDYAEYERVLPGSAHRILKMAEDSRSGFQSLNELNLRLDYKEAGRGQWFAFLLALVALGFGAFLAYNG